MDADYLIDRARLKRRIQVWRSLSIVIFLLLGLLFVIKFEGIFTEDYIARIKIENLIYNDPKRLAAIDKALRDKNAKALIVRINSAGGTIVGGEALFKTISRFRKEKPVIAVMEELATSAGYLVAVSANRIYAHEGTVTGSIGVIFKAAEVTELLKKLGIKFELIKSSPLKSEPSPFSKFTPMAKKATKSLVEDMYKMFVRIVSERRKIKVENVRRIADGRLFTGRMAVANGLVDQIGDERQAKLWLEKKINAQNPIPIRDINIQREASDWLQFLTANMPKTPFSEGLILDGLVSVWHPWN